MVVYTFITIFSFICFFIIYKNRYNFKIIVINIKKNIHLTIGILLFISVLICLTVSTLNLYFLGMNGFLIDKNQINLLSSLSVLDNYLLNFSIFVLCFFLFYKNSDSFFYYFSYLTIIMLSINAVYTLTQILVVSFDKKCVFFSHPSQTIFCDAIAWIDRMYSNSTFSNAFDDYVLRSADNPNIFKENFADTVNSSSIGWISLTAGRAGGVFHMPVESATMNSAGLLLIFILFLNDTKDSLKKISIHKQKFYIYSFFLILLSSILNVSKITSHFTLPVLFLLILLNRKKLKYLISSKCFKFSLFAFFLILVVLFNTKWNGYNLYYTHAIKYLEIICGELKIECKIPAQIYKLDDKISTKEKIEYFENLNFNYHKKIEPKKINNEFYNFIENSLSPLETKSEEAVQIKEKSQTIGFFERFKTYLNYISGGRFVSYKVQSVKYLETNNLAFGYGILIQESFDSFKDYIVFYSGRLSYNIFFVLMMIPFIFVIFYKKKFNNHKLRILLFLIFSVYLLASLGGPIYFINRVSVIYFASLAYLLIKLDATNINKKIA